MLQDYDNNVYTSVIIGSKEWLVENYKTTHYLNGTPIPVKGASDDILLLDTWTNISFDSLSSSGANISNALKSSGVGYIKGNLGGSDILLLSGDLLRFNFNISVLSGNIPRATIYKNGLLAGSTLITPGVNNLFYSIVEDATYAVGFQSDATGSEFSISSASLTSDWNNNWLDDSTGAMCWYNNNISNKTLYGGLYNNYAIKAPGFVYLKRDGIMEPGWRIPSNDDISDLTIELGGSSDAGGKMKEAGTTHWVAPNEGASNSSGMTILPGGYREETAALFLYQGHIAWRWSMTDYDTDNSYVFGCDTLYESIRSNVLGKHSGVSVGLVRDYAPSVDPPEIGPGKVLTVGYESVEFFDRFNITYSIGDIRDLSQGSSDKSYTIELPLTKKNRHILKHINQVDVKSEPIKRARIYIDELIIIQGKIFVLDYTDIHAKVLINSDDWIEALKSKKMNELDLSAYDHQLTNTNVSASWSAVDAFYRYPMIDFGALASGETGLTANWSAVDFIPMIRIVDLITKILYPFTIISDWIAEQFVKDLYILGREKIADADFVEGKHLEIQGDSYGDNTDTVSVGAGLTDTAILTAYYIEFNDVVTDEYPAWDAINSEYTVPETGTYRFKATLDLVNTGNTAPFSEMAGQCTIYLMQSGSASNILKTYSNPSGIIDGLQVILDTGYVCLVENDIIHLEITCYSRAKNNGGSPANLTVGLDVTSKLELIWNNPTRYKGINDMIYLADYMPDMSQADFLGAVRDVFNLRFWMDKARQNIYIEPWDDLHTTEIKDISSLVDYASLSENPAEMISNNYSRTVKMKWKDDSGDEAQNEYLRMYDSPLTKSIVLTSQFCKDGESVKEHPWSTIVEGFNLTLVDYTKMVPRIWADLITFSPIDFNRKVNFNTRLVHWDGYVTCSQTWVYDTAAKDHYPKISGVNWGYVYSEYWQKIFHKIDKGKLYPLKIKVKPGFLTQFMTVINDADAEAFRPIYKVEIDGVENYFRLQRITSDGDIAEIELFLE